MTISSFVSLRRNKHWNRFIWIFGKKSSDDLSYVRHFLRISNIIMEGSLIKCMYICAYIITHTYSHWICIWIYVKHVHIHIHICIFVQVQIAHTL